MENLTLRDYQKKEISMVRNGFRNGRKKILAVLPCGAGKTVLFAYMSAKHIELRNENNVLFLVHRRELIDQTVGTFSRFGLTDPRINIAMVQTVANHVDTIRRPTLIVVDECHHSTSKTYRKIIDAFPETPVVGLTATPCRLDGAGLGEIFDDMEVGVTAKWLVDNGYLSKYDYYAPKLRMEGAVWKPKGVDFDTEDAEKKLADAGIYGDIMKYFNPELRTIIYAPTLAMSRKVVAEINDHFGREIAAHFDGDTPAPERKRIVEDFRSGKIRALSNRDLIGEGFDVPDCDCCMLLRPTKSTALYIQQSMRCMRPKEGKRAVIYDFVGNVYRHGMPDDDRTWSLVSKVKCRNESGEPDIITRTCGHCFRTYSGTSRICPYCGFDNGKTPKQIEEDKKAELERISALEKARKKKEREEAHQKRLQAEEDRREAFREERRQEGMCRSFEDFLSLAIERKYKNPRGWAYIRAKSRGYL